MTQGPFFTTLKDRGLIEISGPNRYKFLQKIITNDIGLLTRQDAVYTCLLSPKGTFLYDFFISEAEREPDILYIECEGGNRAKNLAKRLKSHIEDEKVNIETNSNKSVYAVLGLAFGYKDPRHKDLGYRSFSKPIGIPEKLFEKWDYLRISLGVPDGSRDMISGRTTMDVARISLFNGLCYDKIGYIGHKASMKKHYCGLSKKYLQRVKLSEMPEDAELRSSCQDLGIALIKHAAAPITPIKKKH